MNNLLKKISELTLENLLKEYPIAEDYLANIRLSGISREKTFADALADVSEDSLEEFGLTREEAVEHLCSFLAAFENDSTAGKRNITSLTILGGHNKSKIPETAELTIYQGEIISIVGPTGSGKSRLLEDIECLAQRDTPTGRQILINGSVPDEEWRFSTGGKLVAQLSQNMNFVMDLTVREFLVMHAKSRLVSNVDEVAEKCFACANGLAGEKFTKDTKVTQLSGGQSRALMIADTALMSSSPIILIDEIENAGIDRRKAIELLAGNEKIILMSTHDPLLALRGDKRIVISNGGIAKIIETTDAERSSLFRIEKIDNVLQDMRNKLRFGESITEDMIPNLEN
ncbi:MAG: ABC transporter ATP-binding protein [Methanocorpusculum sp.]|nr:ABC transporter ATP-binding protein [Methanocorpusculum sp.]